MNKSTSYTKKVANAFKAAPAPSEPCYLHIINMTPTEPGATYTANCKQALALLTANELPKVPEFVLYSTEGPITISLAARNVALQLSHAQLDHLLAFQQYLFKDVLNLESTTDRIAFNPQEAECSVMVVVCRKEQNSWMIDLEFMNRCVEMADKWPIAPSEDDRRQFEFKEELYEDAIVMQWYLKRPEFYSVVQVLHNLSPASPFPGATGTTFAEYAKVKHGITVYNQKQPMLDVDHLSTTLNLLSDRGIPPRSQLDRAAHQKLAKFIPELVEIHVIPASLWNMMLLVPSTMYRLNTLLLADELRIEVQHQLSEICHCQQSMDNRCTTTDLLHQALTMSHANEGVSLERLETIGDSFLKYSTTVYLFHEYPSKNEGQLTALRSAQISNQNLLVLGRNKNLAGRMIADRFEPEANWMPPGYVISQSNSDNNLLTHHNISDKSIADCVEALIGVHVLVHGTEGAARFMHWMGLTVLCPQNGLRFQTASALLNQSDACADDKLLMALYHVICPFDRIEDKLGYQFTDKALLVQALTHGSFKSPVTDSFQRLELLGDAVLDYLITRHLYDDEKNYSPGMLTDLRSALVNNRAFASLAVKLKLHLCFLENVPDLISKMQRYAEKIQTEQQPEADLSEQFYNLQIEGEGSEDDEQEEEKEEGPKVLGDLFESVAGALYLDSGCSLEVEVTWNIFYRVMKDIIDRYRENPPQNPVRELFELAPDQVTFTKLPFENGQSMKRMKVQVLGQPSFTGTGRNYQIAKFNAANLALRRFREMPTKKMKNNN